MPRPARRVRMSLVPCVWRGARRVGTFSSQSGRSRDCLTSVLDKPADRDCTDMPVWWPRHLKAQSDVDERRTV